MIKKPTDDFSKDNGQLFRAFILTSIYIVLISYFLFDKPKIYLSPIGTIVLGIYYVLVFFSTSWLARNWPKWIVTLLAILPFVSYFFYVLIKGYTAQLAFVHVLIFFFIVVFFSYIDYGDKKLNPFNVSLYILLLLGIAVTFGLLTIREIHFRLGGLESTKKSLLFTDESKKILQTSPIKDSIEGNKTRPLDIVYETDQAYFIHLSDSSTVSINKSLFFGEVTSTNN